MNEIRDLSSRDKEMLLVFVIGMLSTYDKFAKMTPDEVIDYIIGRAAEANVILCKECGE